MKFANTFVTRLVSPWKLLVGLAVIAAAFWIGNAGPATAGPPPVSSQQVFAIEVKDFSQPADRIDIAVGKATQELKVADMFAVTIDKNFCFGIPVKVNHEKDVNPDPELPDHEIWTLYLTETFETVDKCATKASEFLLLATPVINTNHLVIKDVTLWNTNGTPGTLDDDVQVGVGNARKLDWGKVPRLTNLWLCTEPAPGFEENCNFAFLNQILGQPIKSADPKCVGFPNFLPDEECPRQQLGAFEYEIRFDEKYVDVEIIPLFFDGGIFDCFTTRREGAVNLGCVTKGKENPIPSPTSLAFVVIKPKPDVYSLLRAQQDNGIVVQLINQDCQLADLQGHPIPLEGLNVCEDGAVTIRYLEGDVHADCVVDVRDQQQIAFRWGARLGQLLYNENYDLEPSAPKLGDGDIDAKDLQTVYGRHGSTCHDPHPNQLPVDPKAKVEPPLG
jgi:hypothetical protein